MRENVMLIRQGIGAGGGGGGDAEENNAGSAASYEHILILGILAFSFFLRCVDGERTRRPS
jgi:hypothetical protein